MRYFPPELLNDANHSDDPRVFKAATRLFDRNLRSYQRQLATLETRVSTSAWRFMSRLNTHDGTLLSVEAGDFVSGTKLTQRAHLVNRRRAKVLVRFAEPAAGVLYEIKYSGIKEFSVDYRKVPEWRWALRNCFDDWLIDEWTSDDKKHLCHEVLFSSGAWFRVVFEQVNVRRCKP
jgi:hypothetical protein